jgi:hypothetical protein
MKSNKINLQEKTRVNDMFTRYIPAKKKFKLSECQQDMIRKVRDYEKVRVM